MGRTIARGGKDLVSGALTRLKGGPYGAAFHNPLAMGSQSSANVILPLLLGHVRPRSVIDVGCGTGAWLAECKRLGVTDVVGVDLGTVDDDLLAIDPDEFLARDLSQPLDVRRRFDLAICVEVAEHLPDSSAKAFVGQLTALAPVVAFSAAVPHQGGSGHVNEQWPEYWVERFKAQGYRVIDCLRPAIWSHPDVEFWYAQNLLLFVSEDALEGSQHLRELAGASRSDAVAMVHPTLFLAKATKRQDPLAGVRNVVRQVRRRLTSAGDVRSQ